MELLGDLQSFLEENTSISPATRGNPLGMLRNTQEKPYLMVELAVTVDTALPFVKATYVLDGDRPLALSCYESISSLNAAARQGNYSYLASVASNLSSGDTDMEEHLIDHAKSCVQPEIYYYFQQLSTNMKGPLETFKDAQLFSLSKLNEMNQSVNAIDSLCSFRFLSPFIPGLKEEFPQYIALTEDIDSSYDHLFFSNRHEANLPNWSKAVKSVLLVQPFSGASERIFSLLRNSFGERQNLSLQDYIEASLMLQYKNH